MSSDINIKNFFSVLKKRFWILFFTILLGTAGGYSYKFLVKPPLPNYQSTAKLIVKGNNVNINTLMVMVNDPTVMGKVNQLLKGARSINDINQEITVQNPNSSQILSITAVDPSPVVAAEIANATANVFMQEASHLLQYNGIQILSNAKINLTAIPLAHQHKTLYGFIAGMILGIGFVFFIESLDETIQSDKELEKLLNVPVLGNVPKMNRKYYFKRSKTKDLKASASTWFAALKHFPTLKEAKAKNRR